MPNDEEPKADQKEEQDAPVERVRVPAKDAAGARYAKKAPASYKAAAYKADDKPNPVDATRSTKDGQGSTLMPAAVNNLMIAQQYIDGTKFSIEHKLVSFHYGVALLADGRDDPQKRNLAREYLTAAAGWQVQDGVSDEVARAANRILCEARYNLGVIEELNGNYGAAREQYSQALDFVVGPFRAFREDAPSYSATELGNVALLAHLGWISSDVAELRLEAWTKGKDEKLRDKFSDRVQFPIKQAAILRRQISEFKNKAHELASAAGKISQNGEEQGTLPQPGRTIAVSYRHELLDTILRRADKFVLELYDLAKGTEMELP